MASLPPHWTFEFVDAPIDCGPGLDIGQVYPGPYYCFFESYTPDRMHDAVEYVREIVEDEGPFDAIIGFSQVRLICSFFKCSWVKPPGRHTFVQF